MASANVGEWRITRADETLRRIEWPRLEAKLASLPGAGDVYLVCGGFEDRAVEGLTRVVREGGRGFHLLVIDYRPVYEQNRTEELVQLGRQAGAEISRAIFDRENPAGIGKTLSELTGSSERVFIDVSGMSRLLIVQALVEFVAHSSCRDLYLTYTEALEYPPTRDEWGQRQSAGVLDVGQVSFLSRGIMEIAATPELGSVAMVGEAIRLIAFPSFDPVQLRALIDELQPSQVHAVHGIPPRPENAWRTEAIQTLNAKALDVGKLDDATWVSTLDYRETISAILDVYEQHATFDRIVVAPTGSKMQALAVALVRAVLFDLQIVYPTPQVFTQPTNHTSGVREVYQLAIPIGALREAR